MPNHDQIVVQPLQYLEVTAGFISVAILCLWGVMYPGRIARADPLLLRAGGFFYCLGMSICFPFYCLTPFMEHPLVLPAIHWPFDRDSAGAICVFLLFSYLTILSFRLIRGRSRRCSGVITASDSPDLPAHYRINGLFSLMTLAHISNVFIAGYPNPLIGRLFRELTAFNILVLLLFWLAFVFPRLSSTETSLGPQGKVNGVFRMYVVLILAGIAEGFCHLVDPAAGVAAALFLVVSASRLRDGTTAGP